MPDLEFLILPPGAAGKAAKFDLVNFGRDSWPLAVWESELKNPDCHYVYLPGETLPTQALPEIVALAGVRKGEDAEILTIAVAPARRRQGIAQKMLRNLLRYLCENGALRVFLEVRAADFGAQALYEQFGFEKVGLRKRYYHDDDAVVMRLNFAAKETYMTDGEVEIESA
ncbi:MAG: GNAT family N-acetyltransferase [Arcanobacterium sp.]|nr:GNAT family N-acetyltransferase [Arcanobacterium sp.]